jgi:hypothetical protein
MHHSCDARHIQTGSAFLIRSRAHIPIPCKPPSCRDMPIIGFWYNNARTSLINNQRSSAIQRATMTVWSHIDTPGGRTREHAH